MEGNSVDENRRGETQTKNPINNSNNNNSSTADAKLDPGVSYTKTHTDEVLAQEETSKYIGKGL